ncbi:hypothetical protein SE18_13840 [Herpetosiphon geysericola]|uniref:Uncharacterized protein n=1 Tax=Herpetosiphon geysericola TaxID=70996 RepID=A0A0P6Y0J1_9CHLR|nr:hypothetical protein SE18_13840 [Herpetosiphon geysericola]
MGVLGEENPRRFPPAEGRKGGEIIFGAQEFSVGAAKLSKLGLNLAFKHSAKSQTKPNFAWID